MCTHRLPVLSCAALPCIPEARKVQNKEGAKCWSVGLTPSFPPTQFTLQVRSEVGDTTAAPPPAFLGACLWCRLLAVAAVLRPEVASKIRGDRPVGVTVHVCKGDVFGNRFACSLR